eukprot:SAG31_NODE_2634_length_5342_cov_2.253099_3_plen_146_part_00
MIVRMPREIFFRKFIFLCGLTIDMLLSMRTDLDYNYLSIPYLRKTFGAANTWLAGMNAAAVERDIPVQICMALPSDAMASVQFDSMTNVRSSTDYGINDDRDDSPVQPGGIFGDSVRSIGRIYLSNPKTGPFHCRRTSTSEVQAC